MVVGATVVVVVVTSVVLVGDDDVVVDVVCAGVVRTGHGVDVVGSVAFVDEVATAVESTLTVVVGLSGLRRASGCAAIVPAGGSPVSSVSSGAVWLALVGCGSPNGGPAVWSSCPVSSVVMAIRPANAAMGTITTAAKHPRPLAGSSR